MGSLDTPTSVESGATTHSGAKRDEDETLTIAAGDVAPPVAVGLEGSFRKRKASGMFPLEVGTRVMCLWRDGMYHLVKFIERRKLLPGEPDDDYEYYVHYNEFNRRLDEWVKLELLDLDSIETAADEKVDNKVTGLKMTRHQKRKIDKTHVEGEFRK